MEPTTQQKEQEAEESMAKDAAAMEKLLSETLDQAPPPKDESPPTAEKEPEKHEEPKPPAEPPPPSDTPPAKPPEGAAPELDEFEKELESAKYELPAGATRQAREVNKAVKHTARAEHTARRSAETARMAAEKERDELRAKIEAAKGDREELDRLRPIVETFAIERDPRLNERFGAEMKKIDHRIITNLLGVGLEKATADYIMQHGGPAQFSRDSVSQVEAEPEHEGGRPIKMSHKQFWEERVMKQISDDNQRPIKLAFDDELRLKEWRDGELRSRLSNREQYFKDLEEQSKKQEENFKAECSKELAAQRKELGEIATEREIPKNATEEERKNIEAHNTVIKQASEKFDSFFLDTTPKALIRKNLGGLLLDHMKTLLAAADAKTAAVQGRLDELQKKWDASLKAANTSHRQSVQQQPKPLDGQPFEKHDGRRMEQMMEQLPP